MNKVIMCGRVAKDVEVRYTQSGKACAGFSIAVNRKGKSEGGNNADFFNVVAWEKTAEFIGKYFTKGSGILIEGRLQNRSYDDRNGKKVYITEILADSVEFLPASKKANEADTAAYNNAKNTANNAAPQKNDMQYTDVGYEDIPF